MLSILIPTYNYNIVPLVRDLRSQLHKENIIFEIICIDDASQSELNLINEEINSFEFCSFSSLEKNFGRSKIRNFLAKKAKYEWLIFLDGDVLPAQSSFIFNYLKIIKSTTNKVFCGGVKYQRKKSNINLLHYKHGIKNEEISVNKRREKPYKYFFTSNFLIAKDVFNKVTFEEKLTAYGREDLLFAIDLKNNGFNIEHISNEIFHLGLENDKIFLSKTKQAMMNLFFLENENLLKTNESGLLNLVKNLKRFKLSRIISRFTSYFEKIVIQKKSLLMLDCLKVCYLCSLNSNENE